MRAQFGVDEDEPVLHLALQLVLVHVLGDPPGAVVPLVEVVQVRADRDKEPVIVVQMPGAGFGPVVGVEDAVGLLVDRDHLVVGDVVLHELPGQHEPELGQLLHQARLRAQVRVGRPQELEHRDVRDVVHVASREEPGVEPRRVHGEHLCAHDVRDVALDALVLEILRRGEGDPERRALHDLRQAAAVGAEGRIGIVDLGDRRAGEEEPESDLCALS